MARKEKIIDIRDGDQTLTFKIKQMPASKLEAWIFRALLLFAGSGVRLPKGSGVREAGAFLAKKGVETFGSIKIQYEEAAPLLDEILGCCSRIVENVEERCTPDTIDNYITDVTTLFKLRQEVFQLNFGFFVPPEEENPSGSQENPSTATR